VLKLYVPLSYSFFVDADGVFIFYDDKYPHQDSKRILECLQKSLRIANSATEEIVTVQLYCDTLDQYLYYFDRGAPAVSSPPKKKQKKTPPTKG
jgi:Vacuolar protein sorting-associated protein 35